MLRIRIQFFFTLGFGSIVLFLRRIQITFNFDRVPDPSLILTPDPNRVFILTSDPEPSFYFDPGFRSTFNFDREPDPILILTSDPDPAFLMISDPDPSFIYRL